MEKMLTLAASTLAALAILPTSSGKIGASRPTIYGIHTHRAHRDGLIELPAPFHRGITEIANLDLTRRTDIVKKGRAHPSHSQEVIFEVAYDKHAELEKVLWDVSDPKSSNYGKHWTRQEIADFMDCYDSQKVVVSYLESQNIEVVDQSPWGDEVIAKAPIAVWEKVFSTTFYKFEQQVPVLGSRRSRHEKIKTTAQTVIRAHEYTLPAELEKHVEAAFNTVQFSPRVTHGFHALDDIQPAAKAKATEVKAAESISTASNREFSSQAASYADIYGGYINPPTLRAFYGITNTTGSTKTTQGVYATNEHTYSPRSLAEFQTNYGLPLYKVSTVINGHENSTLCSAGQTTPCEESNADIQYLMSTSELTPTTYWYDTVGDLRIWVNSVTRTANPPKILSVSYGAQEADLLSAIGTVSAVSSYCANFDRAAIVLSLQGVTLFFASGDDGAPGYNVFDAGSTTACTYDADFPAGSPYVTAVLVADFHRFTPSLPGKRPQ
jgi:tripeptidyl-peptidase-1